MHNYTIRQLQWLRALVFLTVLVGIVISIAMNVLNAPPSLTAQIVSAVPPVLVFGAIELIARIPGVGKWFTRFRIAGATVVALGAASISYSHQRAAVVGLGFSEWESYVWPAIIDGFMVVASMSLVSVVTLIRKVKNPSTQIASEQPKVETTVAQPAPVAPVFIQAAPSREPLHANVNRPAGRSGPQVNGHSRPSPLTGKPLMDGPPKV